MSTTFLRTVGDLLDLYLRNMSFLGAHLNISRTLISLSQWMAQDKIMDVRTLPRQGWTLQSLPNPVLFQLFFRNSSLLEFSSSIAIDIWFFRFSQYLLFFFSTLHFYSIFYSFLKHSQSSYAFFPFRRKCLFLLYLQK